MKVWLLFQDCLTDYPSAPSLRGVYATEALAEADKAREEAEWGKGYDFYIDECEVIDQEPTP